MAQKLTVQCTCDCGAVNIIKITPSQAAAALRAGREHYDTEKLSAAGKKGAAKRWNKK